MRIFFVVVLLLFGPRWMKLNFPFWKASKYCPSWRSMGWRELRVTAGGRTSHCLVATLNDTSWNEWFSMFSVVWMFFCNFFPNFSAIFQTPGEYLCHAPRPPPPLTTPRRQHRSCSSLSLTPGSHGWMWEIAKCHGPWIFWMIFEARNFIAAKSVELRAFSDKVQRGSVFFGGQNHAKRLGWNNKLKQVYSRGMCNVASMH